MGQNLEKKNSVYVLKTFMPSLEAEEKNMFRK